MGKQLDDGLSALRYPADKTPTCCPKDTTGAKSCPMTKDATPAKK